MAKIQIMNLEKDQKDLGFLEIGSSHERIILGSILDKGIVGVPAPVVELTQAQYTKLRKNKTIDAALQFWEEAVPPVVLIKELK